MSVESCDGDYGSWAVGLAGAFLSWRRRGGAVQCRVDAGFITFYCGKKILPAGRTGGRDQSAGGNGWRTIAARQRRSLHDEGGNGEQLLHNTAVISAFTRDICFITNGYKSKGALTCPQC